MSAPAGATHELFDRIWVQPSAPIQDDKYYLVKFFDGTGKCTLTRDGVLGFDIISLSNLATIWNEQIKWWQK